MSQSEITAYLRKIGTKGGKASRRKLTKKQARAMSLKRWNKTAEKHKK